MPAAHLTRQGWRLPSFAIAMTVVAAVASTPGLFAARSVPANLTHGCAERFDASADYFPDKAVVEDAANFAVEYRKSYKVVTVAHAYASAPPERYVLVQCGTPMPTLGGVLAGAEVVTVPVKSMFMMSATSVSSLVDLDRMDALTGIADRDLVTSPEVQARVGAGAIVQFAKGALEIDVERVIAAHPGVLISGGVSSPAGSAVRSGGVPVAADGDWLESTALGRAEWMKYIALFLNEERRSEDVYRAMKVRYKTSSAHALALPESDKPLVMTGRCTRGTFVIAGGRSYVAALIKDAGGRYAWADNPATGSASVDLEAQLQRAANADVWINGGGWKNLAAMLEDEPRYSAFKAYRTGQVWTYERRQTPSGGNDYWSRSVTHPDIVLADLVKIFHPALAADRAFEWYMQVPAR